MLGLYAMCGAVLYVDVIYFDIQPSESKATYLLIGALIGNAGIVMNSLYDQRNAQTMITTDTGNLNISTSAEVSTSEAGPSTTGDEKID